MVAQEQMAELDLQPALLDQHPNFLFPHLMHVNISFTLQAKPRRGPRFHPRKRRLRKEAI